MTPFVWVLAVALWFIAVHSLVVGLYGAWRVRRVTPAVLMIAAVAIGEEWARGSHYVAPFSLLIGALLCLIVQGGVFAWLRRALTWHDRGAMKEARRQATLHLALLTGSAIFLVPFAWLVVTSLKEDEDMSQFPPVWVPRQQVMVKLDGKDAGLATAPYRGVTVTGAIVREKETGERVLRVLSPATLRGQEFEAPRAMVKKIKRFAPVWKNYADAIKFLPPETNHGLVFLGNTLYLCILTIIGTILASSLVAFSFARLRWAGRDVLFGVLLATMMLPGAVTMMPIFLIFRWLGWIDTLKPLWVPSFFGSAFNIFLLRQFFLTIPNDLEDAAKIDGCSYFGIYWRIMLPLIKPAIAAITIMTVMGTWNNFMGPLIYVSSPMHMPLAYALQLFQTSHGGEPGLLMAASTMMMLPVLVLFFFTQRFFIQGVTLTGIKG
jgi:multiple sugar transport system permease protein